MIGYSSRARGRFQEENKKEKRSCAKVNGTFELVVTLFGEYLPQACFFGERTLSKAFPHINANKYCILPKYEYKQAPHQEAISQNISVVNPKKEMAPRLDEQHSRNVLFSSLTGKRATRRAHTRGISLNCPHFFYISPAILSLPLA